MDLKVRVTCIFKYSYDKTKFNLTADSPFPHRDVGCVLRETQF